MSKTRIVCLFLFLGPAKLAAQGGPVTVQGGFTTTYQHSSDDDIDAEWLGSLDLLVENQIGAGTLTLYLEASRSVQPGAVSSQLPEANADAGTALDEKGDGRLQVSEFRYALPLKTGTTLHAGLLDATVFLDTSGPGATHGVLTLSGTANDETIQFLGTSFVNNPIIEFPDYAPGLVLQQRLPGNLPQLTVLLSGSNGLADNPGSSYSELFDLDDRGKGVFAAAEIHGAPGYQTVARLGLWTNTRDHDRLDGVLANLHNYGAYTVIDGPLAAGSWNLRLGWANPDVSTGEFFASLAAEHAVGKARLGMAVAWTGVSDNVGPAAEDTEHAELYLTLPVGEHLFVSPDLQYIRNSDFRPSQDAFVYGLRITGILPPL